MIEFEEFPKIARLSRDIVITEKLDGTNAQVWISDDAKHIKFGSRSRWLESGQDNHGFYHWAMQPENFNELIKLGPGRHFGEWWGPGIQRGYGLKEKKFSLFNTHRWSDPVTRPKCCDVVPKLYEGRFDTVLIDEILAKLNSGGSIASPGFMRPEGIVVFHKASNMLFKKTIEKDEEPKSIEVKLPKI